MELKDLNREERLACVALFERMLSVETELSDASAAHLDKLSAAFGEAELQALLDLLQARLEVDPRAVSNQARAVTRRESQELIYGELLETMLADGIQHKESEVLDEVRELWGIREQPDA